MAAEARSRWLRQTACAWHEQLLAAVQAFAKERDYDLILFEGVIYWDKSVDVTPEVLKRLN